MTRPIPDIRVAPPTTTPRDAGAAETSLRYPGWRVVFVCFVTAVFSWGFGFYGQGVYLAELQRFRGWPAALIAMASTAYYLFSAVLVVFVGDGMARLGPRRFLLGGIACLAAAAALIGRVTAPWQLYAAYLLMSFGWAAMGVAAITTLIGLWFNDRRGFAISLALTGSSVGGIVGAPVLVAAIDRFGFASALLIGAAAMAAVLVPMTVAWIGRPPWAPAAAAGSGDARAWRPPDIPPAAGWTRGLALRSLAFWTVTAPFALALLAQVGFLVHQIALLEPRMGRVSAGVAVAVTALAAVLGRLALGFVVDRTDQRVVGAASFLTQAGALLAMTSTDNGALLLLSCAVFGLSVGNVVTLPALIIQREFPAKAFAMLVGFSTAIGQFTYAFGPGLLGLLRDSSGGYAAPLLLCAALDAAAAGIVLVRGVRPDPSRVRR
jgi:MFS family permease